MAITGRMLFTQPETLLLIVLAVAVYFASHYEESSSKYVLLKFSHLICHSLLIGMQFWVTFISGLTMVSILPRHWFSQVSSALFPKYYLFSVLFSGVSLITFYLLVETQEQVYYKVASLAVAFIMSIVNSVLISPTMLSVLEERNTMESKEGIGKGVGDENKDAILKLKERNAAYAELCSRFVKLHGVSALLNMLAVTGSIVHICLLSVSITI